ncbi:hypothetical protein DL96DRAFT_1595021 [Flagelloscypha sp. PMI_526]|nr:hypothetical protein DL96DRAFT_1595021 [Flagelloscypha sp. PMI_526]
MASLIELVDHFESICGISMEKHLLATPGDATVKAAFRTFDIAVPGEEWAAIKEEVEKNAQSVFDDCERMIFDGLPLKDSEPNTTRQVFIAAISAVLINSKGKGGVPKSLNDLLVEIHKSTKDLSSLPAPEGQLDLVIGQLFRRIIKVIGYAQPKPSSRFSLSSPTECDVVKRTAVQEELHHIRWLVDDLQWGFGDFSTVFELKTPPSSSTEKRSWSRSDFFCQTKERIQELRGSPQGEGEEKRFQTALGRLVEVMDGLVTRLPDFEEKIIGDTYDEVVRLLQATKATNSSLEMVSNVLTEVSRCLSGFITSINTPKNKVALARSIVVTLSILQTLPDAIQNHAAHLTVVSAISKISVLNIEQKLNLFHEEIAQLVGDLRSLTAILDGGENVKGPAFAFMWDEASKKNKSLTSTNIGALSDTLLKPHSLLTTPVEAHTRAGTADPCEYSTIQNLLSIHANIETH